MLFRKSINHLQSPIAHRSLSMSFLRFFPNLPILTLAPSRLIAAILSALALSLSSATAVGKDYSASNKRQIILDADTGNEVDDLFAVGRALIEPSWQVTALNATQWQNSLWTMPETMENSHRLNQMIAGHLDVKVHLRRGGVNRMFDWGDQAQHSAAAYEIIKQAKSFNGPGKLTVIALGALTNIGSALFIDPSIAGKLEVYWLGTEYDFDKGTMKTLDFNPMMDQQALHVVLNSAVDLHIIPVNVAGKLSFEYDRWYKRFHQVHPFTDFLLARWDQHLDGGRKLRTIWDLALIQAMIHPKMATKTTIRSSKEFGDRPIHYYREINAEAMRADFEKQLFSYLNVESKMSKAKTQ